MNLEYSLLLLFFYVQKLKHKYLFFWLMKMFILMQFHFTDIGDDTFNVCCQRQPNIVPGPSHRPRIGCLRTQQCMFSPKNYIFSFDILSHLNYYFIIIIILLILWFIQFSFKYFLRRLTSSIYRRKWNRKNSLGLFNYIVHGQQICFWFSFHFQSYRFINCVWDW